MIFHSRNPGNTNPSIISPNESHVSYICHTSQHRILINGFIRHKSISFRCCCCCCCCVPSISLRYSWAPTKTDNSSYYGMTFRLRLPLPSRTTGAALTRTVCIFARDTGRVFFLSWSSCVGECGCLCTKTQRRVDKPFSVDQ